MAAPAPTQKRRSGLTARFFRREPDGSVRLRIRFSPEEASLIEEAAGETPLMLYIHRTLETQARTHIKASRRNRTPVSPPE